MKTQITNLRSGTKNQITNPEIDYSKEPQATSHTGHAGSNQQEVEKAWEKVISENPENLVVRIKGKEFSLKANYSLSGKTVAYFTELSKEVLEDLFKTAYSKKNTPYLTIQNANLIMAHNGKNSYTHICPSLVEIM